MKRTKRQFPIYPRVSEDNFAWVKKAAKSEDISESAFIDTLLTYSRTQLRVRGTKKLFDGAKA